MNESVRWPAEQWEAMLRFIDQRCGLHIRDDQRASTGVLIERTLRRHGCRDLDQLQTLLRRDGDAMRAFVDEMTVGETFFFREPKHFQFLRETILPQANAQRIEAGERQTPRQETRPIGLWSAACSTGEEPYSLAMLCDQGGYAAQTRIVATDISARALEKARRGIYRDWSFRGDGLERAGPYLRSRPEGMELCESIRRRVEFRRLNLVEDNYQQVLGGALPLDVILCRNVFIYFSAATIQTVVQRMADCLVEGGWLLLASADPPLPESLLSGSPLSGSSLSGSALSGRRLFQAVSSSLGVFYRKLPVEPAPVESAAAAPADPRPAPAQLADTAAQTPVTIPSSSSVPASPTPAGASLVEAPAPLHRAEVSTEPRATEPAKRIRDLQARAHTSPQTALEQCEADIQRHPLSAELHYLRGVLLLETNRIDEACRSVQRAVFLDRSLAVGHFLLGSIQQQRGQLKAAGRHYRNVCELCDALPPTGPLPLGEGGTAAELANAARRRISRLESGG